MHDLFVLEGASPNSVDAWERSVEEKFQKAVGERVPVKYRGSSFYLTHIWDGKVCERCLAPQDGMSPHSSLRTAPYVPAQRKKWLSAIDRPAKNHENLADMLYDLLMRSSHDMCASEDLTADVPCLARSLLLEKTSRRAGPTPDKDNHPDHLRTPHCRRTPLNSIFMASQMLLRSEPASADSTVLSIVESLGRRCSFLLGAGGLPGWTAFPSRARARMRLPARRLRRLRETRRAPASSAPPQPLPTCQSLTLRRRHPLSKQPSSSRSSSSRSSRPGPWCSTPCRRTRGRSSSTQSRRARPTFLAPPRARTPRRFQPLALLRKNPFPRSPPGRRCARRRAARSTWAR